MTQMVVVIISCGLLFALVPLVLELRRNSERSTIALATQEARDLSLTGLKAVIAIAIFFFLLWLAVSIAILIFNFFVAIVSWIGGLFV